MSKSKKKNTEQQNTDVKCDKSATGIFSKASTSNLIYKKYSKNYKSFVRPHRKHDLLLSSINSVISLVVLLTHQ